MAGMAWCRDFDGVIVLLVGCMKIREVLEGFAADPADPREVRPTTNTGVIPVPGNFVTPVLAASKGPQPPTPISPVSSTNPGGPPTSMDMRGMAVRDGLPTAMGMTAGMSSPAGMMKDTSTPDLPTKRNM